VRTTKKAQGEAEAQPPKNLGHRQTVWCSTYLKGVGGG